MAEYLIQGETLTAIADQTRRLASVTGGVTPPQMAELLGGLELNAFTAAEGRYFGNVADFREYGVTKEPSSVGYWAETSYSGGYEFTVNEDITIAGIRGIHNKYRYTTLCGIWDENKNILASCNVPVSTEWGYGVFDSPITLLAGKTYAVTGYGNSYMGSIRVSGITINPKITFIRGLYGGGGSTKELVYPTSASNNNILGAFDICITENQSAIPDNFSIETETLNDIANEVIRITEENSKVTPEQMVSALQGIVLQEKTASPATTEQVITPDTDYYALSKVTVNAATLQEKTITPTSEAQEIIPDEGYYGLSKVTVGASEGGSGSAVPDSEGVGF